MVLTASLINSEQVKDNTVFFCTSAEDVSRQRQQELCETGELVKKQDYSRAV